MLRRGARSLRAPARAVAQRTPEDLSRSYAERRAYVPGAGTRVLESDTHPSTVLDFLTDGAALVLFTDENILLDRVHFLDAQVKRRKLRLSSVEVYVLVTSGVADLSVVCPFLRCGPHKVYVRDRDHPDLCWRLPGAWTPWQPSSGTRLP